MNDKQRFKSKCYEYMLFEKFKDVYLGDNHDGGVHYIEKMYPNLPVDYNDVYRKIIKYRIKKYGTSYITSDTYDIRLPRNKHRKKGR